MEGQHDQVFLQILSEEKNIYNFLDAFFGFLFRCTDFYVEFSAENQIGFLPGMTENLVNEYFQKWKIKPFPALTEKTSFNLKPMIHSEKDFTNISQQIKMEDCKIIREQPSDSYNGAIHKNYTWSQTINDLSVIVKIPEDVESINQIRVNLTAQDITIDTKSSKLQNFNETEWNTLLCGQFYFKIRKDESYWSFVSRKNVTIHLEKTVERWWKALLVGEPKIELSKIDCSRNLDELGDDEQMKLEELIWNHQQKLLKKPT